jgi:hypothetical protein
MWMSQNSDQYTYHGDCLNLEKDLRSQEQGKDKIKRPCHGVNIEHADRRCKRGGLPEPREKLVSENWGLEYVN